MGLAWPAHHEDSEICTFPSTGSWEKVEGDSSPTLGYKLFITSMSASAQYQVVSRQHRGHSS